MADKILAGLQSGGIGFIDVAETVEAGDLVGYSTGWKLAKEAATAIQAVGIVDRARTYVSGGDNKVQLHTKGVVRGASGLTPGAPVFIAAGGEVSSTPGANFSQPVGYALSATEWVIDIGPIPAPIAHIANAPAGGTGATAGAYDTAANRDLMIAAINAILVALEGHGIVVKA